MSTMEICVNKLPSPTMSRLKLNNAVINVEKPEAIAEPRFENADTINIQKQSYTGKDDTELFENSNESLISFRNGADSLTAVYDLTGKNTVDSMLVKVEDNTEATLVIHYLSDGGSCFGGFKIRTDLGAGSKLHIVQLSVMKEGTLYTNVQGDCDEGSLLKLTTVCLGAAKAYIGADCRLNGKRSSFDSETAYILGEGELLDMNYNCDHIGKKSESFIKASGVMKAESQKNSRQTINFIKGCSASKGAESEEVLLLDDNIVNKSLPVILCTEEDVEGEHGASIGQPDEEIMYYLTSRGIDEKTIIDMLSAAKIQSAASRIDHEPTVKLIENFLGISEE